MEEKQQYLISDMYKSAATILSRTTLHLKRVTPTLSNVIYSERDDCDSAIDILVIGFKCISHVEGNNQGTLASQMVSMSPLLPTNTTAWFALLKRQFEAVRITDNNIKYVTLAKCLSDQQLQDVEYLMNPPRHGTL